MSDEEDDSDLELFDDFFCNSSVHSSRQDGNSRRGSHASYNDLADQLDRLANFDFVTPDEGADSPQPSDSDQSIGDRASSSRQDRIVAVQSPPARPAPPPSRTSLECLSGITAPETPQAFAAAAEELRKLITQRAKHHLTPGDEADTIRRAVVGALVPYDPELHAMAEARINLVAILGVFYEEGTLQEIDPAESARILTIIRAHCEKGDAGKRHRELRCAAVALAYHYTAMGLLEGELAVAFATALIETMPHATRASITIACCALEVLLVDDAVAKDVTHLLPTILSVGGMKSFREAKCSLPLWRAYVRVLSLFYTDPVWLAAMREDPAVFTAAAAALHTLLKQVRSFKEAALTEAASLSSLPPDAQKAKAAIQLLKEAPQSTPVNFQKGIFGWGSESPATAGRVSAGTAAAARRFSASDAPLTPLIGEATAFAQQVQSPVEDALSGSGGTKPSPGGKALSPRVTGMSRALSQSAMSRAASSKRPSFHGLAKLVLGTRRGSLTLRASSKVETAVQMALEAVHNAMTADENFTVELLSFPGCYEDVAWLLGAGNISAEAATVCAHIALVFLAKRPEAAGGAAPYLASIAAHPRSPHLLETVLHCLRALAAHKQAAGSGDGWRALVEATPGLVAAVAQMLPILTEERAQVAEIVVKTAQKICGHARGVKELIALDPPKGVKCVVEAMQVARHASCKRRLVQILATVCHGRADDDVLRLLDHGVVEGCHARIFHNEDLDSLEAPITLATDTPPAPPLPLPELYDAMTLSALATLESLLTAGGGFDASGMPGATGRAVAARFLEAAGGVAPVVALLKDTPVTGIQQAIAVLLGDLLLGDDREAQVQQALQARVYDVLSAVIAKARCLHDAAQAAALTGACGYVLAALSDAGDAGAKEVALAFGSDPVATAGKLETSGLTAGRKLYAAGRAEALAPHLPDSSKQEAAVASLTEQVDALTEQVDALTRDKAALTAAKVDAELGKEAAQDALRAAEAVASQQKADAKEALATKEFAAAAEVKAAERARAELTAAHAAEQKSVQASLQEVQASLEEVEKQRADAQEALAASEAAAEALRAALAAAKDETQTTTAFLHKEKAAAAAVAAKLDASEARAQAAEAELGELRNEAAALQDALKVCATQLEDAAAARAADRDAAAAAVAERDARAEALRESLEACSAELTRCLAQQEELVAEGKILISSKDRKIAEVTAQARGWQDMAFQQVKYKQNILADSTSRTSRQRSLGGDVEDRPRAAEGAEAADIARLTDELAAARQEIAALHEQAKRVKEPVPAAAAPANPSVVEVTGGAAVAPPPAATVLGDAVTADAPNHEFRAAFQGLVQRARELESALQGIKEGDAGDGDGIAPAKVRKHIFAAYKAFAEEARRVQGVATRRLDDLLAAHEQVQAELRAVKEAVLSRQQKTPRRGGSTTQNPFEGGGSGEAASLETLELRQRVRAAEAELQRRGAQGDKEAQAEAKYLRGKLQSSLDVIAKQSKELSILRTQPAARAEHADEEEAEGQREIEHLKKLIASKDHVARRREEVIALREEDCERRENQAHRLEQGLETRGAAMAKQEALLKDREKKVRKLEKRARERDSGLCRKREFAVVPPELGPSFLTSQAHPFANTPSGTYQLKKLEKEVARMVNTFADGRIPFPTPVSAAETDIHKLLSELRHIPLAADAPNHTALFLATLHKWWGGFRGVFADMYTRYLQKRHASLTDALNAYIEDAALRVTPGPGVVPISSAPETRDAIQERSSSPREGYRSSAGPRRRRQELASTTPVQPKDVPARTGRPGHARKAFLA
eukprot:TRINITY_DN2807_c0_g1_i1.p1 TRINITY_DN2807_c0_g1~~TRINITY_DN2807_c0_g1_i1.p1  ORF type:complete len:1801 (+),score=730.62 TRINITY_DN2807_c0_g1_i1:73-5475(+)